MKRSRALDDAVPMTNVTRSVQDQDPALPAAKIAELDPDCVDYDGARGFEMRCSLPPHKEALVFTDPRHYEMHYYNMHTNRCIDCRRNFPSAHLLDLHIEESHDSFAAVKRDKGEHTYSCFVEGCERKCLTPQKRRLHLIEKHMYPKNFFFAITRDGIDGRRSLLLNDGRPRRRHGLAMNSPAVTAEANKGPDPAAKACEEETAVHLSRKPDVIMEGLAGAMSALRFAPPSVRFGRGGRKAGFSQR